MTAKLWDRRSVGLVLTGGGAKGAYEIGCWRAFREAGLDRFAAVSGTSIGGINAFLVCRGNLEDAERIWTQMGKETPLPWSLSRIALALVERYGLAVALAIHGSVFSAPVRFGSLAAAALWLGLGSILHPLYALALPAWVFAAVGIVCRVPESRLGRYAIIHFSLRKMKRYLRQELPVEFAALFGAAALAVPAGLIAYDVGNGASWWWLLLWPVCIALAVAAGAMLAEVGVSSFGGLAFFSSEALEAHLAEQVEGVERMPEQPALYVTRLRADTVEVPGRIAPETHARAEAIVRSIAGYTAWEDLTVDQLEAVRRGYAEAGLDFSDRNEDVIGLEYVPLAGKPIQEVAGCLIATSAIAGALDGALERLPPGLESDKIMRGLRAEFYDAGWVDNTPVAPLLEQELCDVLVVIFLDHAIPREQVRAELVSKLEQINGRIRHYNQDLDQTTWDKVKGDPKLTPIRNAVSRLAEVEIVPIIPSQVLGVGWRGFLRETLRFREARVRELMDLGFADTQSALREFAVAHERATPAP